MSKGYRKPSVRKCSRCPSTMERHSAESNYQWGRRKVCDTCELEILKSRLEARTDKSGDCWIWMGGTRGNGYGAISVKQKEMSVHVLAYKLFVGEIPEGLEVCHTCDVRKCWRPDHLFTGTHLENMRDCAVKGRNKPPRPRYGAEHPNSRFTADEAQEIRALRSTGVSQSELARRFGCSHHTIKRITAEHASAGEASI